MVSEVILCKYCNAEKDRSEFSEYNLKKRYYICKTCSSEYHKNYRNSVLYPLLLETVYNDSIECRCCNSVKPIEEFNKHMKKYSVCKKCYSDKYYKNSYKNTVFRTEEDVLNYITFIHSVNKKKVHNGETSSMNLSRSEIYELLREQDFKCAITKISFLNHLNPLLRPSIDRIDSNIGYRKENCQIVLRFINLGKNKHSQEELFECLKMIKENCVI